MKYSAQQISKLCATMSAHWNATNPKKIDESYNVCKHTKETLHMNGGLQPKLKGITLRMSDVLEVNNISWQENFESILNGDWNNEQHITATFVETLFGCMAENN